MKFALIGGCAAPQQETCQQIHSCVPNVSMVPGVFAERAAYSRRAGQLVMAAIECGGPLPRDIVTRKALENACAMVAATGGSTNAALHIPAIAHEAGIRLDLDNVAAVCARTPVIADLGSIRNFVRRLGMIGAKEPAHAATQRASYPGRHPRPVAGRRRSKDRL